MPKQLCLLCSLPPPEDTVRGKEMAAASAARDPIQPQVLSATCPDEACRSRLFFPSYDQSVECPHCGQRHDRAALRNIEQVSNPGIAFHSLIRNILIGETSAMSLLLWSLTQNQQTNLSCPWMLLSGNMRQVYRSYGTHTRGALISGSTFLLWLIMRSWCSHAACQ